MLLRARGKGGLTDPEPWDNTRRGKSSQPRECWRPPQPQRVCGVCLCFFLHKNAPTVSAKLGFPSVFSSVPEKSEMQLLREKEGGELRDGTHLFSKFLGVFYQTDPVFHKKHRTKGIYKGSAPSLSSGNPCFPQQGCPCRRNCTSPVCSGCTVPK